MTRIKSINADLIGSRERIAKAKRLILEGMSYDDVWSSTDLSYSEILEAKEILENQECNEPVGGMEDEDQNNSG